MLLGSMVRTLSSLVFVIIQFLPAQFVVDLKAFTLCPQSLVHILVPKPGLFHPLMILCVTTNRLSSIVYIAFETVPDIFR